MICLNVIGADHTSELRSSDLFVERSYVISNQT